MQAAVRIGHLGARFREMAIYSLDTPHRALIYNASIFVASHHRHNNDDGFFLIFLHSLALL